MAQTGVNQGYLWLQRLCSSRKKSFKSHKNVPQWPSTTGRGVGQSAPSVYRTLSGSCQLCSDSYLHFARGRASHSRSPPVTEGGRDDSAGWLWVKGKPFTDSMANEDVSFLFNDLSTPSLFHWSQASIAIRWLFQPPTTSSFPLIGISPSKMLVCLIHSWWLHFRIPN